MGRVSSLGAFTAVTLAFTLFAVGTADARIVLGRGAAGVAIGESRESVLAKLGKPASASRIPGPNGYRRSSYRDMEIYTDEVSRVFMIVVTGRTETFSNGIGLGTTLARLKRTYPNSLRCDGEGNRTSSCSITTTWRQTGLSAELSTTEFMIDRSRKVERIIIFRSAGT